MSKVAFVVTKSEFGGAQEYLRILMSSMNQYEVVLISGDTGFLTEIAIGKNVTVRICEGLIHPVRPLKDLKAIFNMCRLLREEKPDLVHANSSKAGIVARIAAFLIGIPAVFTAHGWAFTDGVGGRRARFFKLIEKMAAPITKKIICVSNYDTKLALHNGVGDGSQLLTVHNGIPDVENGVASHSNLVPRVAMVARFRKPKDYHTLLHAVSMLKDLNFTVQCVGDGPLLAQSRALADKLGIQDKVEFMGARSDIVDILRNADIFALISDWEGFPISILEGMRAGLPVVATRVGGIPEAVSDRITGLLVEPKNSAELSSALRVLISDLDTRKRMGQAGRERYLRLFTAERMVVKTTGVYENIFVKRKGSLVSGG